MTKTPTNREAIMQALEANDYYVDLSVASYISCPKKDGCKYQGEENTDCCDNCKAEWLNDEFKC